MFNIQLPSTIRTLMINCPATTTVIVNIKTPAGTRQVVANMGISLQGGITAGSVIYNYNAYQLEISGVQLLGTTFAPMTDVYFVQGMNRKFHYVVS